MGRNVRVVRDVEDTQRKGSAADTRVDTGVGTLLELFVFRQGSSMNRLDF